MQNVPETRGEMSQDSAAPTLHRSVMKPGEVATRSTSLETAARTSRGAFMALSASSVGLEMGLSVIMGLLGGYYLDRYLGTTPWMMLLFLCFGLVAGFRGVIRAVARSERAAAREAEHG